ncbi:MAG: sigma 54-interacting transcriptional regulator [Burkholderiales bacterium]
MRVRKLLLLLESTATSQQFHQAIQSDDWDVLVTHTIAEAKSFAGKEDYHVGIVLLENLNTFSVYDLERLTMKHPVAWLAVVAAECLQNPAFTKLLIENFYDHHTLPLDVERLLVTLGHAHGRAQLKQNLNKCAEWVGGRYQMVGKSAPMQALYGKLDRITKVDAPVLIIGESGTGKELVAHAIHANSWRTNGPFIPVNCGGLAENLIHSELFGHEKGSFTGAYQRKIGSIEAAGGGVIFLDEVGDLPLGLQANLLRFLQEKTIVRLGSTERIHIDVRVVAATHVDLQKAVREGQFREDLYYRLNVLHLNLPPLRERPGDVELFTRALFAELAGQKNRVVQGFSQEALRAMNDYEWPGNVRELVNRVQRALIMSENRLVNASDLGLPTPDHYNGVTTLSSVRAAIEKNTIQLSLISNANNVSAAARNLGVSRVTLYRLMDKFDINVERKGPIPPFAVPSAGA